MTHGTATPGEPGRAQARAALRSGMARSNVLGTPATGFDFQNASRYELLLRSISKHGFVGTDVNLSRLPGTKAKVTSRLIDTRMMRSRHLSNVVSPVIDSVSEMLNWRVFLKEDRPPNP